MIAVARTQIEAYEAPKPGEALVLGDPAGAATAQKAAAPLGYVRAPAGCLPGTYGLTMDEAGGGLLAPPGSTVVVEPVAPTGAGLAVLYFDGLPEIWDLTHDFIPGSFDRNPGTAVAEFVKVVQPHTGRIGFAKVDAVEKAHRVVGVYRPDDVMRANRPAPRPLPLYAVCPEGMGEYRVETAAAYPAVRPGETVIFDPSRRDLVTGQLCVIEWSNGRRSALLTDNRKPGPNDQKAWWVDPVNRPSSAAVMERLLKSKRMGALFASDGPYGADNLRSKIVGHVVGILVPNGATDDPDHAADQGEVEPGRPPQDQAAPINADPIMVAIQRHAAARSTLEAASGAQDIVQVSQQGGDASPEAMARAKTAYEAASAAEAAAWKALFEERPTTLPGVLLLLWHAERWAVANDGLAGGPSATEAIGHIADSLAAVVGTATEEVRRATSADAERRAFVVAAADMLDHELVTEIWSRARELRPSAFDQGGARHAG